MATRIVEWKKPYTWWQAIEIDENKVISLRLRDENNLIIYDSWDDEIYADLQLPDEITPTDAFPVWVTTGRVVVDNGWDKAGTIICAKTTSWDVIKLVYADEGTLWIDNGTGTFKQIYFKWDVDTIVQAIYTYIDDNANTKTFFITWSSTQRKEKLGEAISYILSWKNAIVNIWGTTYTWIDFVPWDVELGLDDIYTFSSAVNSSTGKYWELKVNVVYTNPHSSTVRTYTDTEHSVWGWWWSDIEYVTQAEYNALLPWALTDNKHYFIYEESWWGWWWQPWANTMLYLPMDTDLLDHSGNSLTVTNLWSVALANVWLSFSVAQFNSTSTELTFPYQWDINNAWTISFWENTINQNTDAQFITAWTWSRHNLFQIWYTSNPSRWLTLSNYGEDIDVGSYAGRDSSWHLITATYSGTAWQTNNAKVYVDWVLVAQWTMQWWNWQTKTFMIWNYNQETSMWWYLSKFIVETAERTTQEVSDYFDLTKWNYWIS
jgi:hypothetical protein